MPTVLQHLCDPHFADDVQVAGAPHTLTIDGVERVLILCEEHEKGLLGILRDMMQEHGAKTNGSAPAPAKRAMNNAVGIYSLPDGVTRERAMELVDENRCIYDPTHGPFSNRQSTAAHLRTAHDVTIKGLGLMRPTGRAARKTQSQLALGEEDDVARAARMVRERRCPLCVEREFRSSTMEGLRKHLSVVHGKTFGDLGVTKAGAVLSPSQGVPCEQCDPPRHFGTHQGLASHVNRTHRKAAHS